MSHYNLCSNSSLTMSTRHCVHSENNITAADISVRTICRLTVNHQGLSSWQIQCTPKVQSKYSEIIVILKKRWFLIYGAAWISSEDILREISQSQVGRYGRIPLTWDLWSWQTQYSRNRGHLEFGGWGDGKQLFNGCSISLGVDQEKFWKCISVTT